LEQFRFSHYCNSWSNGRVRTDNALLSFLTGCIYPFGWVRHCNGKHLRTELLVKALTINFLIACLLILSPLRPNLIAAALLVLVDLACGLLAAKKRGEPLSSAGLRRTIAKLLVYEGVVILGFIVETFMLGDLFPLVKILSGMIGLTELKSVLENLEDITGLPLIKLLIDKLTNLEKQ
jgi:hypothetical protein